MKRYANELAIAFYDFGTESIIMPKIYGIINPPQNKMTQNKKATNIMRVLLFPIFVLLKNGTGIEHMTQIKLKMKYSF